MCRRQAPERPVEEEDSDTKVLREYYSDHEFFLSPEWILKILTVLVAIASSALFISDGCSGAQGLAASGAAIVLSCAGAGALACAVSASQLPQRAPRVYLLVDLIISTAISILLLVTHVIRMVFCQMYTVAGYLHGPLGIVNAAMAMASAVVTYRAVTRRMDASRPAVEPRLPPALEQEA